MDKKNFIFHVVNSVKGGCGKSTFSLLLGEYWRRQGNPTYIIDLDICGTSWELDYGIGTGDNEYIISNDSIYINDVIDNYRNANNRNVWHCIDFEKVLYKSNRTSLSVLHSSDFIDDTIKSVSTQKVYNEYMPESPENPLKICMADPKRNSSLDSYELDLFENAIEHLIETNIFRMHNNSGKQVHIILDMPPSNERHAERVLNNWLLDHRFAQEKTNYSIQLYLLSSIDRAHMYSNLEYLVKLLKKHSITDCKDMLIKDERFKVRFILNDILSVIDNVSFNDGGSSLSSTWLVQIKEKIQHMVPVQCNYLYKLVMPQKITKFNEDFPSIPFKNEPGSLWSSIMTAKTQPISEKDADIPYVDTIFGLITTED